MIRRSAVRGVAVAAIGVAALAGCSEGSDSGNSSEDSTGSSTVTNEGGSGENGSGENGSGENGSGGASASEEGGSGENGSGENGAGGALGQQITSLTEGSPITFQPMSAELTESASQTVTKVAEAAQEGEGTLQVQTFAGYDDSGKADELSEQRADAIKAALTEAGLSEDRVETEAMGNGGGATDDDSVALGAKISVQQ